jgi:hypothetical protein
LLGSSCLSDPEHAGVTLDDLSTTHLRLGTLRIWRHSIWGHCAVPSLAVTLVQPLPSVAMQISAHQPNHPYEHLTSAPQVQGGVWRGGHLLRVLDTRDPDGGDQSIDHSSGDSGAAGGGHGPVCPPGLRPPTPAPMGPLQQRQMQQQQQRRETVEVWAAPLSAAAAPVPPSRMFARGAARHARAVAADWTSLLAGLASLGSLAAAAQVASVAGGRRAVQGGVWAAEQLGMGTHRGPNTGNGPPGTAAVGVGGRGLAAAVGSGGGCAQGEVVIEASSGTAGTAGGVRTLVPTGRCVVGQAVGWGRWPRRIPCSWQGSCLWRYGSTGGIALR